MRDVTFCLFVSLFVFFFYVCLCPRCVCCPEKVGRMASVQVQGERSTDSPLPPPNPSNTHTHTHTLMHTHTRTHIHTLIHTRTHTHSYTHMMCFCFVYVRGMHAQVSRAAASSCRSCLEERSTRTATDAATSPCSRNLRPATTCCWYKCIEMRGHELFVVTNPNSVQPHAYLL